MNKFDNLVTFFIESTDDFRPDKKIITGQFGDIKLHLHVIDNTKGVESRTWEDWKKLKIEDKTTKKTQEEVIKRLMNQIKHFGKKMEGYEEVKNLEGDFVKVVDVLIKKYGCEFPKTGLKTNN